MATQLEPAQVQQSVAEQLAHSLATAAQTFRQTAQLADQ
jgi:hypothetical protein